MMVLEKRSHIVAQLQTDILRLQKFCSSHNPAITAALEPLKDAFPNGSFPLGAVHEFLSTQSEDAAATGGFIAGLIASLIGSNGTALWISSSRTVFPPALKMFGIMPDRFIFVDIRRKKDIIWAMDEALKCSALTAVVGEMPEISFTESRRLQLAVEQSQVTGFILRHSLRHPNTTACVSRWKITALPSDKIDDLPGVGFPKWKVELLRMRNGRPGSWSIQWKDRTFQPVDLVSESLTEQQVQQKIAG